MWYLVLAAGLTWFGVPASWGQEGLGNVTPNAMEITVTGLDKEGISLVGAPATDFDSKARVAAPGWDTTVSMAKPFVVLVSNDTPLKVVAFALTFEITDASGKQRRVRSTYKSMDSIIGIPPTDDDVHGIAPRKQRLMGIDFAFPPFTPVAEQATQQWLNGLPDRYRFGNGCVASSISTANSRDLDWTRETGHPYRQRIRSCDIFWSWLVVDGLCWKRHDSKTERAFFANASFRIIIVEVDL